MSSGVAFQLMPELDPEVDAALKESIRRHGVLMPIVVDQHGRIIDGHNRSRIADELLMPCPRQTVEVADEDHARELARTLNVDRRQLTPEQRRAVARSLRQEGFSYRAIAGALGTSHVQVQRDLDADLQVEHDVPPEDRPEPEKVTGTDGKQQTAKRRTWTPELVEAIVAAHEAGRTQASLAQEYDTSPSQISTLIKRHRERAETPEPARKTREAVTHREDKVREMAAAGNTSAQIAEALDVHQGTVKNIAQRIGVEITADRIVGKARRHDPNRIVSETAIALDGLAFGISLVDFDGLDTDQIEDWATSISTSLRALTRFHKQLKEMTQ